MTDFDKILREYNDACIDYYKTGKGNLGLAWERFSAAVDAYCESILQKIKEEKNESKI